ncbi:uncharacterized protein LOC112345498 [Selaginella moellendorffii]|uniref:uncharacterized protein LOC112345498 n=1 Tax=Selaginella moellendorffii TaxID=88036 RepID=UPI000D1CD9C8|nr:uncharacterized protein LOC112345498 [Selaginella moellendorffii]|eukprot:XP_024528139.1 uncharacterized protein LOC112345498 [Selaginella moellendorffii]
MGCLWARHFPHTLALSGALNSELWMEELVESPLFFLSAKVEKTSPFACSDLINVAAAPGAWPVLVVEFVDHMYRSSSCSCIAEACVCDPSAVLSSSEVLDATSQLNRANTLPGMAATAGSKRRRKDERRGVFVAAFEASTAGETSAHVLRWILTDESFVVEKFFSMYSGAQASDDSFSA